MERSSLIRHQTRFIWIINRFNICSQPAGEPICSPDFSLDSSGVTKFCLYIYPRGYTKSNDFISIYLVGYESNDVPSDENDMHIELNLFAHQKKNSIHSASVRFKINKNVFCEISCIKRSKIFVKDDEIFTFVNIKLALDVIPVITKVKAKRTWICKAKDLEKLSCDLSKGLEIQKHHDLILKSDDGSNTNVHKSIIISRYPKLADTLGLKKIGTNSCHLSLNPSALRNLLKYIYSGKIDIQNVPLDIHNILHGDELPHLQQLLFSVPKAITASTTIRVRHCYFIWNIPNLNKLSSSETLSNSVSCDNNFQWAKLQVKCYFVTNEKNEDYVAFSIQRIFVEESLYIACTIRIMGIEYVNEYEHLFMKETEWKIPPFVSKRFLMDNKHLFSEFLKISFEINISDGNFTSEITSVHCPDVLGEQRAPIAENLKALQYDFKNLHENPVCSDIILNVAKEKFHAHRVVLSLRSPVFSKILENKTVEKESEVAIKDFEPDVVKTMLSYIYCGEVDKVPQDINFVENLYTIADKYELPELKGKCVFHFKRELNSENAGKILIFADSHNDDYLKDCVKNFICTSAKEILNSDEWKKVMNERMDLAADVLTDVLSFIGHKQSALSHQSRLKADTKQ